MKEIRCPVQTNSKFTFEIVTLGGINKSIKNLKSDIQLPKKIFYLLQCKPIMYDEKCFFFTLEEIFKFLSFGHIEITA